MPLLYIEKIDDNTQLGAWLFDKSTNLKDVCPSDVYNRTMTMCNNRQKETAAVYALLNEMLGRGGWTIDHEDSGRPILRGSDMEIGISHTKNYASIILSRHKRVAVDIEYISDRIFKIEDKFMRSDERDYSLTLCNNIKISDDTHINKAYILLLFWCAKETVYKYYSDEHMALHDIMIERITESNKYEGCIRCKNTLNGETQTLIYKVNDNTVLTYLV